MCVWCFNCTHRVAWDPKYHRYQCMGLKPQNIWKHVRHWAAVGLHYLLDMYLWSQYSTCRRHKACCEWWYFCWRCSSPHRAGWSAVSLTPLAAVQVLDPQTPRFPSRWCCSCCRCGPENAAGTQSRCTGWWELLCPVATGQSRSHAPHCPGTRDACRPAVQSGAAMRSNVQDGTATDQNTQNSTTIFNINSHQRWASILDNSRSCPRLSSESQELHPKTSYSILILLSLCRPLSLCWPPTPPWWLVSPQRCHSDPCLHDVSRYLRRCADPGPHSRCEPWRCNALQSTPTRGQSACLAFGRSWVTIREHGQKAKSG